MSIYVGSRDVTDQLSRFFSQPGPSLNGVFSEGGEIERSRIPASDLVAVTDLFVPFDDDDTLLVFRPDVAMEEIGACHASPATIQMLRRALGAETRAYTDALTYLEGQLTRATRSSDASDERVAIAQRFETYRQLIASHGCEDQNRTTPYVNILEGMYEELTQYIESEAFDRVRPPAMQQNLVALQAETFSRLTQMGAPRHIPTPAPGTGTEAETPRGPFQAYQPIIDSVRVAGSMVQLDSCGYDAGDASSDAGALPVYYQAVGGITSVQPQPFEGDRDVNTDFRYRLHEAPIEAAVAEGGVRPAPTPGTRVDLVVSDDPIAGMEF